MRKSYLKEHRPILYNQRLRSEKDVYKRQVEYALEGSVFVGGAVIQCILHLTVQADGNGRDPVSYTHLDVYKRQTNVSQLTHIHSPLLRDD